MPTDRPRPVRDRRPDIGPSRRRDTLPRSDKDKDFTTLGIGSGPDQSTDDQDGNTDTGGTLGLGAVPFRSANKAEDKADDKAEGDEGKAAAAPPTSHSQRDRVQELRRQRNAQIQAFLEQAESAMADKQLEQARVAIEQAVMLSPDNPRVISVLEAVEQAEQAHERAERARQAEQARRAAEQARQIAAESGAGPADGAAHTETVEHSGAASLLFASGDDPPLPSSDSRPSSIGDVRLGDVRVLAGLAGLGVVIGILVLFILLGGSDEATETASRESISPAAPTLPPPVPEQPQADTPGTTPVADESGTIRERERPRAAAPVPPPRRAPAPVPRVPPPRAEAPPPLPSAAAAEPGGAVRIAGDIPRPTRTINVPPTYPAAAAAARIQGNVILETEISAAGQVTDVKVLHSVDPLIDAAALAAARQWVYTPTVVDGAAVPVVMIETVFFRLDGTDGAAPAQAQRSTPPAAPPPAASSSANPVRIAGDVPRPTRTKDVVPTYPADAIAARVAGIVILETVIGANGQVSDVTVLRSVDPLVDAAAVAAARQWIYTPTILDGAAVPVIMTETVNFVLPPSMDDIDPRTLLGLSMEQVRSRVGAPEHGDVTTWTYQSAKGTVTLTFGDTSADGSPGSVTRVESPQGSVRRLPR